MFASYFRGRVTSVNGDPIVGASIYIRQANGNGGDGGDNNTTLQDLDQTGREAWVLSDGGLGGNGGRGGAVCSLAEVEIQQCQFEQNVAGDGGMGGEAGTRDIQDYNQRNALGVSPGGDSP